MAKMSDEKYIDVAVGDRILYSFVGYMTLSGKVTEKGTDYLRVTDESLALNFPSMPWVGTPPPIEHYHWIHKRSVIERLSK